jgi:hypothetical protein
MTVLKSGLTCFILGAAALATVEGTCRLLSFEAALAEEPLDIRTPNQLVTKLHYLENFPGYKVVLLGDSIVYGGILQDFGDAQWREHTLTPLLRAALMAEHPGKPILVMNLGINGALPADVECLAKLVVPCKPDVVIFSTHLRPFSADFAGGSQVMARPWLRDLSCDQDGTYHYCSADASWLNNTAGDWLRNHLTLFRCRDTIQTLISEGPWPSRVASVRHALNGDDTLLQISRIEQDPLILLLQFKKRFSTVNLSEDHAQTRALRNTLEYLRDQRQQTVVFYVKENPDQVDSVVEEDHYQRVYGQLVSLLQESSGPRCRFVPPIPELEARYFLDLCHLNADGYAILTKYLMHSIKQGERE